MSEIVFSNYSLEILESEKFTLNIFIGCSLLHWAAINNRCIIATLLINNGAIIDKTGGALGETPLQWAINKKYYSMIQLLILKG